MKALEEVLCDCENFDGSFAALVQTIYQLQANHVPCSLKIWPGFHQTINGGYQIICTSVSSSLGVCPVDLGPVPHAEHVHQVAVHRLQPLHRVPGLRSSHQGSITNYGSWRNC